MSYHVRSDLNEQVYEEACTWLGECRSDELGPQARREFDRWLRASPEHLKAYLEVAAIWDEGSALDSERRWDSAALAAAASAGSGNVVPLSAATRAEEPAGLTGPGLAYWTIAQFHRKARPGAYAILRPDFHAPSGTGT